jgi:DNA-binding HxlR family transcriptional regulator
MLISYILNTGAELVGKKWRAVVIWYLKDGPKRFSELKRAIPAVSVKVLSEVLKEMEDNELIIRKQYPSIPVKVTYELHPDAFDFVEANVVCTIKIGEYIIKNHDRLQVPSDTYEALKKWLVKNPLKMVVSLVPLSEVITSL